MNMRGLGRFCSLAILHGLFVPSFVLSAYDLLPPAVFSGETKPTANRLADASKRLATGKWAETIEEIQQILDTAADDLAPLNDQRSVQTRLLCHVLLASLPPAGLELYRKRVEPQARQWLIQARAKQDNHLLRKIVNEAYCSRSGEEALNLLGDLAFEQGQFTEAECWWRALLPVDESNRGPATLVYPDPVQPRARVQAKLLLARFLSHADPYQAVGLANYRKQFGEADGTLAGRKGKFADILQAIFDGNKSPPSAAWRTLGGDSARGQIATTGPRFLTQLSLMAREGPEWRFSMADRKKITNAPPLLGPARNPSPASLAFHPLIANGKLLTADARYVTAYDLQTGLAEIWFDAAKDAGGVDAQLNLPAPANLRYTLTLAEGCLLARLGGQDMKLGGDRGGVSATYIACLRVEPNQGQRRLRWVISPPPGYLFEGTPLARNGLICVAAVRLAGDRVVTSIFAYPLESEEKPPPRWQVDVCETKDVKALENRARHHLLTQAGPNLVYCTHSGAVIAVDAATGKRQWGLRYPSHGLNPRGDDQWSHDLSPCVCADGKVFVAPIDSDRIMCLDPLSGQVLWQRERLRVAQLLGVKRELLFFTTATGLRCLDAATGTESKAWQQIPGDGSSLPPRGRGLLVGDLILWPTTNGIFAVRQRDGNPADNPTLLRNLPSGNLLWADECLAVSGPEVIEVYMSPAQRLNAREKEAKLNPTGEKQLRLARAQADAGQLGAAIESLQKMPANGPEYRELLDNLVLARAQEAIALKQGDCELWYRRATRRDIDPGRRVQAFAVLAGCFKEAGEEEKAVACWQAILDDPLLADAPVRDSRGLPATGQILASDALGKPIRGMEERLVGDKSTTPSLPIDFAAPFVRQWHINLDANQSLLPVTSLSNEFLLADAQAISCRKAFDGEKCWNAQLGFRAKWAEFQDRVIIVGGSEGLAGVRPDNGAVLWRLPPPAGYELSAFQVVGGRIFCFLNGRKFLAVDARSGRSLWAITTPGGHYHTGKGQFFPCFSSTEDRLIVQTGAGSAWLLDATNGRVLSQTPAPEESWQGPPLTLPENRFCIVESANQIVLRKHENGEEIWAVNLPGFTTATGELPQIHLVGKVLLVVVPTNLGYRFQLLSLATGKSFEGQPILLRQARLLPCHWSVDGDTLVTLGQDALAAWSLADGRRLWEKPMPPGTTNWRIMNCGPSLTLAVENSLTARFQFHWLSAQVQWDCLRQRSSDPANALALILFEPRTGHLVQRMNFPASRLDIKLTANHGPLQLLPRLTRVANGEPGVVCVFVARKRTLIVANGNQCWGLQANDSIAHDKP